MAARLDRLGIAVVYLVEDNDEDLLDLHLDQIRAHTDVPYTIFGSASRLKPGFRRKIETRGVRIHECPPTQVRGYEEHAYYLDRLIEIAVADGVSHVATLNVDSFPIRPGWARELAGLLSPNSPLAAVRRDENQDTKPHPSCMFFDRDFYLACRPRMLLTEAVRATESCRAYLASDRIVDDTGVGYGYALHAAGLGWHPLLRSNKGSDHYIIGSVYGDLVFHLGGAARPVKFHVPERAMLDASPRSHVVRVGAALAARVLPTSVRRLLSPLKLYVISPASKRALDAGHDAYRQARERLRTDPVAYFDYLRFGRDTGDRRPQPNGRGPESREGEPG